ncbi:FBD-associated F-box protein At5g60610-like [Rutidosis leptorrhynchoides]|uniref:FBD-associated F-box protein At5g60610-like n=1 Tax=Rutidosis leptorrhynchoides TaxID=125765 RepID=UPI003A992828
MEKMQRRSQCGDVPVELIQRIQSLLAVKEAARTCVLSKTWSQAWSTIPRLRFHLTLAFPNEEKERDYIKFMDRTMSKYIQHNIPIESLKLKLDNHFASHFFNKWISTVAAQCCLRELYIRIFCNESDSKLILSDEIFSGKILHTLSLRGSRSSPIETVSRNSVINCANLRLLKLEDVEISEELLDTLFSTCILLEKIVLSLRSDMKTFKLRNLCYLQELKLITDIPYDVWKIDNVPNLRLFDYFVRLCWTEPITKFNVASLTSVTKLSLHGVTMDVEFLDMIKSKLPSLEILDLVIRDWTSKRWDFTSSSLKRLTLIIPVSEKFDIQVNVPNLHHFSFSSRTMPSLVFPSSNGPEYIKLELDLFVPVDRSFFLTMRELLNLSSKFDIEISNIIHNKWLNIDNEDREIRFTVPYTNVQQLSYYAYTPEKLQGHLSFFDALITLCHPKYVTIYTPKEEICDFFKPLISGMMAKKKADGKDIEFKNNDNDKGKKESFIVCPHIE